MPPSASNLNYSPGETVPNLVTVLAPDGTVKLSNLNYTVGQTVPNAVVVRVGADGQVKVFNNAGSTHVIADVAGWFNDGSS